MKFFKKLKGKLSINSENHFHEKGKIIITKNGPYKVSGNLPLAKEISLLDKDGTPCNWKKEEKYPDKENYFLCRCGNSCNKPFCDGTHMKINFDGTETATKEKYIEQVEKIVGPEIDLTDVESFCSNARFCHKAGGAWALTENSDNPESKKLAIQEACDCPSGRLVAWDKKSGKQIEPDFQQSISLIEDPGADVSGPIWVKGKIDVESEEKGGYESRNRVTLCRCGKSKNKPFCDGSHIEVGFRADNKK